MEGEKPVGEQQKLAEVGITVERLNAAVESERCFGYCTNCGAEHYDVEPYVRKGFCGECGKWHVFGMMDLLDRIA